MFVRALVDFEDLVREFGSNHVSGVAGTYVEELVEACQMLAIDTVVLGRP
jgi:L-fucose isomerase